MTTRVYWESTAIRLAKPVLTHLADRTLRLRMPVEKKPGTRQEQFTHLEAFGRLLAGLAPWLELGAASSAPWADLARQGLDSITDPESPDAGNFSGQGQPLVDAAFLSQALLRAPRALWEPLEPRVKRNVISSLRATRSTLPPNNNWLLFAATVEAALYVFGESDWDRMRIAYALRQHEQWYLGDGVYGDGPDFHADYYNAFVIHPMIVEILSHLGNEGCWGKQFPHAWDRMIRYSAQIERMISPEGTFPPLGRSLAYRFGCLQPLGLAALRDKLPAEVSPAQVRCAMTAVIRRMIEAPGTFDSDGWLRIGFCGAQPGTGEDYISTGSLYLCSAGLLPLGLPESSPFWSTPDEDWTSVKAWSGQAFPIDKAMSI